MAFHIPMLLAYITTIMTLEPGDLVATGTPAGVGTLAPGRCRRSRDPRAESHSQHRQPQADATSQTHTHMPRTTARYDTLPEYLLTSMPQKKRDLIAKGVDVIDLGAGDADLAPPREAVEALDKAAHNAGDEPLRIRARAAGVSRGGVALDAARFGLTFDPMKEVVPLIGSKEGIAHLALAYVGARRRRTHPRARLSRVSRRIAALGGRGAHRRAASAHELPARARRCTGRRAASHAAGVSQLSEQSDGRDRAARLSRAHREALP